MSITYERPGVYASYSVTSARYAGRSAGIVGICAAAESGTSGNMYTVGSRNEAASLFGADCALTVLAGLLLDNGVAEIKAIPLIPAQGASAPADSAYERAFAVLSGDENIEVLLCDSWDGDIHALMKTALTTAAGACIHKIGIVECGADNAEDAVEAAGALNCERMVMAAPAAIGAAGAAAQAGSLAACIAGALVTCIDPAVPLNGAELYGISGVSADFNDAAINSLVRGGVTPVECTGGTVSVVRGITTKTTASGGGSDYTYRELTTVRIIDDVIPAVRQALKSRFSRVKNTAQTRGAIRSLVLVELEKKLSAEIIDGYSNVSVTADPEDDTVCLVSFEFTVAHGLNQIQITANITV
ncbi:MAG: phage tail sheath protein [Oscillospiraceae bacterium]|nr:phage tail sheath protein [Oscillospiraceae bacterium]